MSSHSSGSKSKNRAGWARKAFAAVPIIVVLFFLYAFFVSHKKHSESESLTTQTQQVQPKAAPAGEASGVSVVYTGELPKGGSISIPAKNDNNVRSDPVHIPAGFTICRDADRGSGTYRTWYRNRSVSDDWKLRSDSGPYNATEESYMSNASAQQLAYRFVPASGKC